MVYWKRQELCKIVTNNSLSLSLMKGFRNCCRLERKHPLNLICYVLGPQLVVLQGSKRVSCAVTSTNGLIYWCDPLFKRWGMVSRSKSQWLLIEVYILILTVWVFLSASNLWWDESFALCRVLCLSVLLTNGSEAMGLGNSGLTLLVLWAKIDASFHCLCYVLSSQGWKMSMQHEEVCSKSS